MKVAILGGAGKVGMALNAALSQVYDVTLIDKTLPVTDIEGVDFLHVAIPWQNNDFHGVVKTWMTKTKAKRVIVHSTVPTGTTRLLGTNTAHSPILGQHDDLEYSLFRFVKWLGVTTGTDRGSFLDHLTHAGLKVQLMASPESTETCKLLCLSRYLNDLAFYENAQKILKKAKVSPYEFVRWTKIYNDGYAGTKFQRSELKFPNGVVGGTCVLQNSKVLADQFKDEFTAKNLGMFKPN